MFLCEKCGKSFSSRSNLKMHELIHTGKRPHVCKHCNRSFTRAGHLEEHERIHTGECPYICKYCKRRFKQTSSLKAHERTHTGYRPYVYNHCGRSYTTCGNLRRHERSRKYHCIVNSCVQIFCDVENLEKHKRTHTGETLYACKMCQKNFTQYSHLCVHQRSNHTITFPQNIHTTGYSYKHIAGSERNPFDIIHQCNSTENLTTGGNQPLDLTSYEKRLQPHITEK